MNFRYVIDHVVESSDSSYMHKNEQKRKSHTLKRQPKQRLITATEHTIENQRLEENKKKESC